MACLYYQWEADLVDIHGLAKYNNNFKFLLNVIDSLSKYAFVIPLKAKMGSSIVKAFTKIFKARQPRKLHTDSGKVLLNRNFQQFLKARGIIFFTSNNETNLNHPLWKGSMWRYFTVTKQERYIDVLQHLVDSYNRAVHSSTRVAPDKINVMNAEHVWRKMYKFSSKKKTPKIKVDDFVRISKTTQTFEKGYQANWTREIFKITRIYKKPLPEYTIQDLQGDVYVESS